MTYTPTLIRYKYDELIKKSTSISCYNRSSVIYYKKWFPLPNEYLDLARLYVWFSIFRPRNTLLVIE